MNRIVVLGSTGFLGKSLRKKLSEEKLNVKYMIHKKNIKLKKNEFFGDILDEKSLQKNIRDGDIVVNLVGQFDNNLSKFFDTNLKGSFNLLNTVKLKKNVKIIFASSINVYGNNCKYPSKETDIPKPSTIYGVVKYLTEQLYKKFSINYNLNITVLRFANLYGKNKKNGIISKILKYDINNPVIFTHNGKQQRDFLFIDDAINGIISVFNNNSKQFEVYNISSGKNKSLIQLVKLIEKIYKKKINYKLSKKYEDEKCIWADNTKAKKMLKFDPKINLENGIILSK